MDFYKQSRFQAPTLGSDFVEHCHNFHKQKTQAMFEIAFSLSDWFCVCHLLLSSSKHQNIYLWPLSQPQSTGKVTLSAGGPAPSQKSKRVLSEKRISDRGDVHPTEEKISEGSALLMRSEGPRLLDLGCKVSHQIKVQHSYRQNCCCPLHNPEVQRGFNLYIEHWDRRVQQTGKTLNTTGRQAWDDDLLEH